LEWIQAILRLLKHRLSVAAGSADTRLASDFAGDFSNKHPVDSHKRIEEVAKICHCNFLKVLSKIIHIELTYVVF